MQNTTFIFEEDNIFCEDCYQKDFAQTCHSCKQPVVGVSDGREEEEEGGGGGEWEGWLCMMPEGGREGEGGEGRG